MRPRASVSFSAVQQREIRMNLRPASPKMNPGVMKTFVPYKTSSIHCSTSGILAGALAQRNNPDCLDEYVHPRTSSILAAAFLLPAYILLRDVNHSWPLLF